MSRTKLPTAEDLIENLAKAIAINRQRTGLCRLIGTPPREPSARYLKAFHDAWDSDFPEWDRLRAECRALAAADPTLQVAIEELRNDRPDDPACAVSDC